MAGCHAAVGASDDMVPDYCAGIKNQGIARRRDTAIADRVYMELEKLIAVSMQVELAMYLGMKDSRINPEAQRAPSPLWCD